MNEKEFRDWVWDHWFAMGETGQWAATLVVGQLKNRMQDNAENAIRDLYRHGKTLAAKAPSNPVHGRTVDGAMILATLMVLELPEA